MKNWKYETTNFPGWFFIPGVCGEIEGENNAHMLAAAPAMYEALDEAHAALIIAHGCKLTIKKIEAALRAADGGE